MPLRTVQSRSNEEDIRPQLQRVINPHWRQGGLPGSRPNMGRPRILPKCGCPGISCWLCKQKATEQVAERGPGTREGA